MRAWTDTILHARAPPDKAIRRSTRLSFHGKNANDETETCLDTCVTSCVRDETSTSRGANNQC